MVVRVLLGDYYNIPGGCSWVIAVVIAKVLLVGCCGISDGCYSKILGNC